MTDIITIAGSKQSGKSTLGKFIAGFALTQMGRRNPGQGYPTSFDITDDGKLIVNSSVTNAAGEEVLDYGELDLERRDYDFVQFAEAKIWPWVRIYNFADLLKEIGHTVFGLEWNQLYGSDDDKNQLTKIKWHDAAKFLDRKDKKELVKREGVLKDYMTGREFMQFFGTDICRELYDNCWVESCFRRIQAEQPAIAIICDCRFQNEVDFAKANGAHVIKLTRQPFESKHRSETEIQRIPAEEFTAVIDNANMTIREKNQATLDVLYQLGIFQGFVS